MSPPAVVALFDANVLFKQNVFSFFLGAHGAGAFSAKWTHEIEHEARTRLETKHRYGSLAALSENLRKVRDPLIAGYEARKADVAALDPGDTHVLAAAIELRACSDEAQQVYLVSGDERGFDPVDLERRSIALVRPDDFGLLLWARNPHALVRHVSVAPPDRLKHYLEGLERELPKTLAQVRPFFVRT